MSSVLRIVENLFYYVGAFAGLVGGMFLADAGHPALGLFVALAPSMMVVSFILALLRLDP